MTTSFDKDLLLAIARRKLVPFVGAGASLAVNQSQALKKFPSWKELLQCLVTVLQSKDAKAANRVQATLEDGDLLDAADIALKKLGPAAFADAVVDAVSVPQEFCDLRLTQAIWGLKPRLVVTTNYDRVLQWGSEAADARVVLNSSHRELQALFDDSDRPPVWHLHGHVDTADSLILAPSQYRPLYSAINDPGSNLRAAAQTLDVLFTREPVLFIGFSMSDDYVLDAIEQGLQTFKGYAPPRWALLKQGDDRSRKLWDRFQVRVIEYSDHGQPLIDLLQELAAAASAAPVKTEAATLNSLPAIPPLCREYARQQCAHALPLGVQPSADLSISLQNVYVPALVENPGRESAGEQESADSKRPSWQLLMERLGVDSLYLAGNAGYGKSTFGRWLCLQVLAPQSEQFSVAGPDKFHEVVPESLQGRLPVLIPFRDMVDELRSQPRQAAMSADEFLALLQKWAARRAAETGVTPALLKAWLQAGRTLLIFDGIDELPTAATAPDFQWNPRNVVVDSLPLVLRAWGQLGNRVLLTSRPYGLEENQRQALQHAGAISCSLQPLPEELQTLLVNRWFSVLPKYSKDPLGEAQTMLRSVRSIPRVNELISSPLQLTAICVVYGQGGELPKDIHDLYNRLVRSSLSARYQNDTVLVEQNRNRLARIAWGLHTGEPFEPGRRNPLAEAGFVEIDQILAEYVRTNPQTDAGQAAITTVREELLQKSGLLVPKADGKAAFQHLSFQEFLAAEWFSKTCTDQQLLDLYKVRGLVANWRETLRFLFGRRVDERDQSLVTNLAWQLLQHVEQQTPVRVPTLAVVCCDAVQMLLDRGYQLSEALRACVRRLFRQSLEQLADLVARHALGLLVSRIGDDRPGLDLLTSEAWVWVPAGDYRLGEKKDRKFLLSQPVQISRYPVTNAEFRKFVEAGGYEQQEYWKSGWEEKCQRNWSSPGSFELRGFDAATQPAAGLSWYEASAFCEWMSVRDDEYQYALLSEELWEAAARGLQGYQYSWGDEWKTGYCNSERLLGSTSVVGTFPQATSPCGAVDMTGNVWEWTSSLYKSGKAGRVLRGGSWSSGSDVCSAWYRDYYSPGGRGSRVGFRLART
ncbi:MAG: SUMF1/EgtB/PvdO family nonheme iron enzyme, partial [Planctomycetaceae bacterium]